MGFTAYAPAASAPPAAPAPSSFTPYAAPPTTLPAAHPIADTARSIYSAVARPPIQLLANIGMAAQHLLPGQPTDLGADLPLGFGASAHISDPYAATYKSSDKSVAPTVTEGVKAIGQGAQTIGLGLGPVTGGAAFGAGAATEQGKPLLPTLQGTNIVDKAANLANDNVLGSAATGAAFGKVGELGAKAAGGIVAGAGKALKTLGSGADALYSSAQRNIERVLAPTTKVNKLSTEKLAPQAARVGLPISLTRSSLLSKLEEQANTANDTITKTWENLPQGSKVDASPIVNNIQSEIDSLKIKGPKGDVLPSEQQAYHDQLQSKLDELKKLSDDNGHVDAAALRAYRQSLDASIKQNKLASFSFSPTDNSKLAGTKLAANSTREEIAKQVPGVAGPNKQFNFFHGLADILDATITRKTGQGTPLGEKIFEGAGAASGFASHGLTGGIEYAVLAKIASKVVQSTAWQTASAAAKKSLGDAIASHDGTALSKVLSTGFNLAGTGLEHVGNFIKGIPGAAKDLPQQAIPGTAPSDIARMQPGLSMRQVYLHPDDQNALIKYVDAVRLNNKPSAPAMTEDDYTAAERILTKAGVSLDQPQAKLAQIAEELINGDRSTQMFAPTGRPFKNETPTPQKSRPRATRLPPKRQSQ